MAVNRSMQNFMSELAALFISAYGGEIRIFHLKKQGQERPQEKEREMKKNGEKEKGADKGGRVKRRRRTIRE